MEDKWKAAAREFYCFAPVLGACSTLILNHSKVNRIVVVRASSFVSVQNNRYYAFIEKWKFQFHLFE